MKYIALLRGINVGGNNKVSMKELAACFEALGFKHVTTYINSGNVLFEDSRSDLTELVQLCESAIKKQFGFKVICSVIEVSTLKDALDQAPKWWDVGDAKHNALFVIAPAKTEEIMQQIGEAKPEYEKVAARGPIIFWSAPVKTFSRTRYSKVVGTPAYQSITIRNSNTTKKLLELADATS